MREDGACCVRAEPISSLSLAALLSPPLPSMESDTHSRQPCGLGEVSCVTRVSNRRPLCSHASFIL